MKRKEAALNMKDDNDSPMWAFAMFANALSGGGDMGCSFPRSDAEDLRNGARYIPGEVTFARRRGEHVRFVQDGDPDTWHWVLEDGSIIR